MFKYQNITIPAKKGLTLIWPAGFTHVHKGQVSHTKDKLILTGWWRLKNETNTFFHYHSSHPHFKCLQ